MLPIPLKQTYDEIPASVKQFAKRALILLAGWLFVYHIVLLPRRIPDRWLTNGTTAVTAFLLHKWYSPNFSTQEGFNLSTDGKRVPEAIIKFNGRSALGVADACNALELYVLYVGFLFCMPTGVKRLTAFALAGIVMIFILNIARLYALTWLSLKYPGFFDFAHHYVFTLIVYSCIFGLWVWYSKKINQQHELQ